MFWLVNFPGPEVRRITPMTPFPGVLHRVGHPVGRITFLIKSLAFIALLLRMLFLLLLNVQNQSELILLGPCKMRFY